MIRRGLWVTACLFMAAASPIQARSTLQPILLPGGGTVRLRQRAAAAAITAQVHGRTTRSVLPTKQGIYAGSLADTTLVGAIGRTVAVVLVDYASNPSGGIHQCGAGTETVVRVIALSPRPHQTFAQLVASCWTVIDAGEISWNQATRALTIERTTYAPPAATGGAATAEHTRTTYSVAASGAIMALRVERLP